MGRVPESTAAAELLRWIAYERDAAWAAKLAIVRACRREDIAHFGACLCEHDRHAAELSQLVKTHDPAVAPPTEPCFVAGDAYVVGAIESDRGLLEAMDRLESARIRRYERRRRNAEGQPRTLLDGLLERHLADARARRTALRRLGERHGEVAA